MWTVQALVVLAVLLAAQVVWWLADDAPSHTPHWVVGAVWLFAGAAYAVAMPQWRYRVHRWEATPRAIYTQSGWLWQGRPPPPPGRGPTPAPPPRPPPPPPRPAARPDSPGAGGG